MIPIVLRIVQKILEEQAIDLEHLVFVFVLRGLVLWEF